MRSGLALLLPALLAALPTRALGLPPACGPLHRGANACMAGQVCTCDWFSGGSITDERPGWRWACRIEQMCGAVPPAGDDGADGTTSGAAAEGSDDGL